MAGFVSPIIQGLLILEDHKKQQAAQQQIFQQQTQKSLQDILINNFMKRYTDLHSTYGNPNWTHDGL